MWEKKKTEGVIFQADMEKVYDHVHCQHLIDIMEYMGFGIKWHNWITTCISLALFSVLLNGSPVGFFNSFRGLRQGDPLSPFLFNLVVETLCRLIAKAEELELILGCCVGIEGPSISLIQFVDDALFLTKADMEQVQNIQCILLMFEASCGLKVNLEKSRLMGVGDVQNITMLVEVLGCRSVSLLVSYLGLPLGAKVRAISVWDPVIERVEKWLATWKGKFLSRGGKITLINSVLSNLPTYFMSLFLMPKTVCSKLEK